MAGRICLLDLLHELVRHLSADLLCLTVRALEFARAEALWIHVLHGLLCRARGALRPLLSDTVLRLMELSLAELRAGAEIRAADDGRNLLHLRMGHLPADALCLTVRTLKDA